MGTVIVAVIVAAAVGLIIFKMIKDRRSGKGGCSCGGDCGACGGGCHSAHTSGGCRR